MRRDHARRGIAFRNPPPRAPFPGQAQPDPRQGDAGVGRQTLNDGLHDARDSPLGGDGDGETEEPFSVHGESRSAPRLVDGGVRTTLYAIRRSGEPCGW